MHYHHKSAHVGEAKPVSREVPGNRPPILPQAALLAGAAWYLLATFIGAEIALLMPYVTGAAPVAYEFELLVVGVFIVFPVAYGMRNGKLWAVRLFNYISYAMAVLYVPILISTFYLWFSGAALKVDALAPDLAIVFWIFSGIELVGFSVLFRALKRVRWLDPNSLPHEWEPPANPRRS